MWGRSFIIECIGNCMWFFWMCEGGFGYSGGGGGGRVCIVSTCSCVYVMVLYFVCVFEGVWYGMCWAIIWALIVTWWFAKEYSCLV